MNLFVRLEEFLKFYYDPGTELGAQDKRVNKKIKVSILGNIDVVRETDMKSHIA